MGEPIRVLVVDDQFNDFAWRLSTIEGIEFSGLTTFTPEAIFESLDDPDAPTVMLLDILGRDGNEAGITLFNAMGNDQRWQDKKGSVQIVFFSSKPTEHRQYTIAKAKRIDVAGYVKKNDIFAGNEAGLSTLRKAHEVACRYRTFPSLADPIRAECELVCSPNSHAMQGVWEKVLMAGRCWEPVLIQGETGTGKELVAQAIFKVTMKQAGEYKRDSGKAPPGFTGAKRIIAYNIGSAPTEGNLQYTELFGATPESASGVTKYRKGIFERADGGTVFLDEIGDAASIIQVALLRVLQEKEIIPLGGFAEDGEIKKSVSFRLVTASHIDLPQKVQEGRFRADLYYRLNTIQIKLPPLRERKDDIPVLVYTFLDALNEEYGRVVSINKEEALFRRLKDYDWPGNVRQLQMAVRASYVMSPGDELVLSDDIERMLDGGGPTPPSLAEQVLDGLRSLPRSLPDIAKQYGLPLATEVARLFVRRYGRHPDDDESKRLFASNREAVRKWTQNPEHKVPSPKGKSRGHKAKERGYSERAQL